MFRVMVPYTGKKLKVGGKNVKVVSYPPSGYSLYSRESAVDLLKKFYNRYQWTEGSENECWAESDTERFTLHFPEKLI